MPNPQRIFEVLQALHPAYHAAVGALERQLAGTRLSVPMRGVMGKLRDGIPRSVPTIAVDLRISRQFALRIVLDLEQLGFVARSTNPAHKRSDLFAITASGADCLGNLMQQEWLVLERATEGLSEQDLAGALAVLECLARNLRLERHGTDASD